MSKKRAKRKAGARYRVYGYFNFFKKNGAGHAALAWPLRDREVALMYECMYICNMRAGVKQVEGEKGDTDEVRIVSCSCVLYGQRTITDDMTGGT